MKKLEVVRDAFHAPKNYETIAELFYSLVKAHIL